MKKLFTFLLCIAFYANGVGQNADPENLRHWADQLDFNIGCAIDANLWAINPNGGLARSVKEHNMMVAENRMKLTYLRGHEGTWNFDWSDQFVQYAMDHDMTLRGHVLTYFIDYQLPRFIEGAFNNNVPLRQEFERQQGLPQEELDEMDEEDIITQELFDERFVDADSLNSILKEHVTILADRYKGQILEWDVFNEYFDGFNSLWKTSDIGETMLDSVFRWAHEADPDAFLYYTDYGIEQYDPFSTTAKSRRALQLVKDLLDREVPIHGVGFQSHFAVGAVNFERVDRMVKEYAALGLRVSFCEVDFRIPIAEVENPDYLRQQAEDYASLMKIALENDNVHTFLIWGVRDTDSWRAQNAPILFDSRYNKKPAYYGVLNTLAGIEYIPNSVEELGLTSSVMLSPNPAVDYVFLNNFQGLKRVEVYGLNGVKYITVNNPGNKLNISELPSGIYMVVCQDSNNDQTVHKLVKAN